MRLHEEHVLFLMIDIQERLFPHIYESSKLEENCQKLLKGIAALNLPLLVTEQYVKGLGPTIPTLKALISKHHPLEKVSFSCCDDDSIAKELRDSKKQSIIIFGIEAHVCILQTALDLLEKNYHVVIVEDCVASRKESDKRIALSRLSQEGVRMTSYESILLELCRYSGTERFKAISKIIK